MRHSLTRILTALVLSLTLFACGGKLESSRSSALSGPPGAGSGSGSGSNAESGSGGGGGGTGGFSPKTFVNSELKCVLEVPALASRIRVFVDSQLRFYQGFEPPAFPLRIFAGKGGQLVPFEVLDVLRDPAAIRVEATATPNPDGSASVLIRGLQLGILPVGVTVRNGAEVTTCGSSFIIEGAPAPVPSIVTRANGAETVLPMPLSTGEAVRISWTSANTRDCLLSQDGAPGIQIPPTGEIMAGPFTNAGSTLAEHSFVVTCFGTGSTELRSSTVRVGVNPVPTLSFNQVGGTALVKVGVGANVNVEWASQFATGGCTRQEGANGTPVMVDPSGTFNRTNVTADTDLIVTCKDRNQGLVTRTVQIRILRPAVAITANNVASSYTVPPATLNFNLKWTATDVDSCSVNPGGMAGTDVNLSIARPLGTTEYTVTCQSALGEISSKVNVVVPSVTRTFHCASGGHRYTECPQSGTILSIVTVDKVSAASCRVNRDYGMKNNNTILWVDNGCRANFTVVIVP